VIAAAGRRFTVGFSYAGEDRPVVAPVAERLAARLGRERLLFDKFHEAELARPDLDVYLPRLYRDQTELIVVVLSPDYPRKRWCGLEWRWIRQLILGADQERIMLLKIGNLGDLSELGIVAGDGYLDITSRPADAIAAAILERLGQPQPEPPPPSPWFRRRWSLPALVVAAAGLLAAGWLGGRPLLARWHLQRGDGAFVAYTKLADAAQLERARQAWQQAAALDPAAPEALARLGFSADFTNDLAAAERQWRQAAELVSQQDSAQAQEMRNGLANVLAQLPGRRTDALGVYDGDRFYPRSAIDAAMLRWPLPGQLPQALDAIHEPALAQPLAGQGPPAHPWGFKTDGTLLLFESRAHQRCLLGAVRATTAHLSARVSPAASPLMASDCKGIQDGVQGLLCDRLLQAQPTNPRAAASRSWLGCAAAALTSP
jgi:tetratricopeptide (TPR) repeat protein